VPKHRIANLSDNRAIDAKLAGFAQTDRGGIARPLRDKLKLFERAERLFAFFHVFSPSVVTNADGRTGALQESIL